ncbi:MAG: DUF362 domain-containing protein [Treponema sp.]|nr:DUF362 domain-containing protein [Treponema sp.]
MKPSVVYFTDFRTNKDGGIPAKLQMLIKKAGIAQIDFDGKFTAIKMHFGEGGNLSFLRPDYARAVADVVKELGGKPFLTDCNTLYPGYRKNALDHLTIAEQHGFLPMTTGCQVIIGDGLKGTDDIEVPVHNGEYCKTALIGRAIMDADIFISLAHFKGHESTGFGGAIKNIGMGCGSRAGKMEQHKAGKPEVNEALCRGCRQCAKECGSDAITYSNNKAHIDQSVCKGCGRCIGACNFDAIYNPNEGANEELDRKMAEYAQAVCYGRPCFHINIIRDVSPYCDCHEYNDAPVIPNIGMAASFDPIALDQACSDLCMKATRLQNSLLTDNVQRGAKLTGILWKDITPVSVWDETLIHGEKIGLGTRSYELKTV